MTKQHQKVGGAESFALLHWGNVLLVLRKLIKLFALIMCKYFLQSLLQASAADKAIRKWAGLIK